MAKVKRYTKKLLQRERRARADEARSLEKSEAKAAKRRERAAVKVDSALRGCEDA